MRVGELEMYSLYPLAITKAWFNFKHIVSKILQRHMTYTTVLYIYIYIWRYQFFKGAYLHNLRVAYSWTMLK